MQRIQNSHVVARTAGVLAMLIPAGISGCAPLHHFVKHPASVMLAEQHRTYYHSPHSGRVIPKDGCFTYCEPGCFGYEPTCWQPWPAECPNCPVREEVVISEKVIGGGDIYEAVPGAPVAEPVTTAPHAPPGQPQPPRLVSREEAGARHVRQPRAASPTTLVSQPTAPPAATPTEPREESPLGSSETMDMPVFPADHGPTLDHSEMVTSARDFGPPPDIFEHAVSSRRRTNHPDIADADDEAFDVAAEPTPQPEQPTEAVPDEEAVMDSLVAQPLISNADADLTAPNSHKSVRSTDAPLAEKVQGIFSPEVPLNDPFVIVSQPETTGLSVKDDTPSTLVTERDEVADVHIMPQRVGDADPMERDVEVTDGVARKADEAAGQALPKVTKPASPLADLKATEVTDKARNRRPLRVSTLGKPMIRFANKTERTVVKIDATSNESSASLRFRD